MDLTMRLMILCVFILGSIGVWQAFLFLMRKKAGFNSDLPGYKPGLPALVYFYSEHCAPCRGVQKRIIDQIEESPFGVQVFRINAEENPDKASRWGVLSLPTTIVLGANGTPVAINPGVSSAKKIQSQLAKS